MTSSLWMREAYLVPATLQLQQLSSTTFVDLSLKWVSVEKVSQLGLTTNVLPYTSAACRLSYHPEASPEWRDRTHHRPTVTGDSKSQKVLSISQGHPRWTLRCKDSWQVRWVAWTKVIQHLNAAQFSMFLLLTHSKQNRAGENVWLKEEALRIMLTGYWWNHQSH